MVRRDVGAEQFKNIDKKELKVLIDYFKKAGIRLRQCNTDQNESKDIDDMLSDEIIKEIKLSQTQGAEGEVDPGNGQGVTISAKGRKRVPRQQPAAGEDEENDSDFVDDDEAEDESFSEASAVKDGSEGSEGEEDDMEDDIDDDVIDKKEMAALNSNRVLDKKDRRKGN